MSSPKIIQRFRACHHQKIIRACNHWNLGTSSPKIIQSFRACHHYKNWSIFLHQRFHAFFCPSLHDEVFATVLGSYPAVSHCMLVPFDGGNISHPFFQISLEICWLASFDWPQPDFRQFSTIISNFSCPVSLAGLFLACPVLADLSRVLEWSNKLFASNIFRPGMLDRVHLLHSSKKVIDMLPKNDHFLQTYCHYHKIQ